MKKVLVFSLAYFPKHVGGAEIAIKEITDRIPPSDMEFYLITHRFDAAAPREEKVGNVHVTRVGGGKGYFSKILFIPRAAAAGLRLHAAHGFSGAWAMMSYMMLPIIIMRIFGVKIPYAVSLQEGDPFKRVFDRPHIAPFKPALVWGFRHAETVQAISNFLAGWATKLGAAQAIVIPNGVDISRFAKEYSEREIDEVRDSLGKKMGDVYLITSSRLVIKNAVDELIRSLLYLPGNVHAVILGTGEDEAHLKNLAKKIGVENRTRFMGHISHEELPLYLKACDIFVRASRSEGMGNSFVEAMAAGIPVVGTQEGGIADFLFDEKKNPDKPVTGWAVPANDPRAIADAVMRIMKEREKVHAVVATAKAMVLEQYNWDLISKEIRVKMFAWL